MSLSSWWSWTKIYNGGQKYKKYIGQKFAILFTPDKNSLFCTSSSDFSIRLFVARSILFFNDPE
jgi:hypothetical protein